MSKTETEPVVNSAAAHTQAVSPESRHNAPEKAKDAEKAQLEKTTPEEIRTGKVKSWAYETKSGAGTIAIGRKLAELLPPPRLLILRGDLGAGKTTLVKGIASALGAAEPDEVTSPTFTLVHDYTGSLAGKPVKLLHLDLYRLDAERQLESLGIDDMQTPDALILVEWGEKFKSIKKRADGEIAVTSLGGDVRRIVVTLE